MRRKLTGTLFYGACLLAIAILILALIALLLNVLVVGAARGSTWTSSPACRPAGRRRPGSCPHSSARSSSPSSSPSITFPIGIGAAVYLAEYASDNRLTRLLQTNISNLAGVPSIIYGIFGLAIFVRLLGFGPVLFSGAATLALVILPLVIIASFEALKAVPQAQREGAYALGASQWQMVRGSVLPAAAPGIMTGIILAMARAIGEAAPLVVVGAATFVTSLPQPAPGRLHGPADPGLQLGTTPAGRLPGHRRGRHHRDPRAHLHPEPARPDRAGTPVEAHPVVEETPVNAAQAGSTLDAPVDGRSAAAIPAIHIATEPSADRATAPPRGNRHRAARRVLLLRFVSGRQGRVRGGRSSAR